MTQIKVRKFEEILEANGIKDEIRKVEEEKAVLSSEHLGSECDNITIHFMDDSKPPLYLFLKRQNENPLLRNWFMFEKESVFYNNFLRDCSKFWEEKHQVDDFCNLFPKCYKANENEIVLENLLKRGFTLIPKTEGLELSYAKLTMINLAKIHGTSYALAAEKSLKHEFPKRYSCFKEYMMVKKSSVFLSPMFENNLKIALKLIKENVPEEETKDVIAKLTKLQGNVFHVMCDIIKGDEHFIRVVNHGDCWSNNLLFVLDNETKLPTSQIFVDFQIVRIGSPNLDISYFLWTSVKAEVKRSNWKDLLQEYFDELKKIVEMLGNSVTFTFDDFLSDYARTALFGLILRLVSQIRAVVEPENLDSWSRNHPEKVKELVKEIVLSVKDYLDLQTLRKNNPLERKDSSNF